MHIPKNNIIIEWYMKVISVHFHLYMPFHAFLTLPNPPLYFSEF